jgi:hypothetical protein
MLMNVSRANRRESWLLNQRFSVDQHHFSDDEEGLPVCFDAR